MYCCFTNVQRGRFTAGLLAIVTLLLPMQRADAQVPGRPPQSRGSNAPSEFNIPEPVDVLVNVRESNGMPLAGYAIVKLYSSQGAPRTATTQDGSIASFPKTIAGEYELEVTASGYKHITEHASVFGAGGSYPIYVYLHPENESSSSSAPSGAIIMTPRLQAEIDKGLDKLRKHEFEEARKHLEKAVKIAPGNPDVQYLLGMLEYVQQHFGAAREKLQAVLSVYPTHERSLLALGELELRTGDSVAAAQTLEKAYLVNGADWRTHLLLADAYFQMKNYEKALPHATRATQLAKESAPSAWILLGRILMSVGKRDEAKQAFETVIRSFPSDSSVPEAKRQLAELSRSDVEVVSHTSTPTVLAPALPPAPPATIRPWAPPDVDSKEYAVVQDVACKDIDVIRRTEARTARQLGNFEKFLATEHIEHQEVDAHGNPGPVREKEFNYIVFVEHPKPGMSFINERRDGGENLDSFPTSLATQGLAGLAVNIFDPNFAGDLEYKCEGLGTWRGQAAWRMRFEQKKGVPSQIRTWRNNHGTYPIPLKGRAWISASSYDVLHVETDLREPVAEIQLSRDHLIVDYGPVNFEKGKTTLWLPWSAEMFMELRGKRYHHRHTLTNYMLFSVETGSTIAGPKANPQQKQP